MSKKIYYILKRVAGLILLFNIISLIWVILYGFIPIPTTKLMVIEGQSKEISYTWVNLEEISGRLQLAVMCAEDQYFLIHNGLDFNSIEKAIETNKEGKRIRGASTLSQQVAKNAFLWPNRDWSRKVAELYFTLLIEMVWSKERIMEVYLNVAEFGEGIFGVEAASQTYFKKSAAEVTITQAARLAAVLPSPKRYSANRPSPYVIKRTAWIKTQMKYWGNEMTYDEDFVLQMMK